MDAVSDQILPEVSSKKLCGDLRFLRPRTAHESTAEAPQHFGDHAVKQFLGIVTCHILWQPLRLLKTAGPLLDLIFRFLRKAPVPFGTALAVRLSSLPSVGRLSARKIIWRARVYANGILAARIRRWTTVEPAGFQTSTRQSANPLSTRTMTFQDPKEGENHGKRGLEDCLWDDAWHSGSRFHLSRCKSRPLITSNGFLYKRF